MTKTHTMSTFVATAMKLVISHNTAFMDQTQTHVIVHRIEPGQICTLI